MSSNDIMTKQLYAWKSGPSVSDIRYRVVTSSETLTLDDNGRTIYIDANENCIVMLPLSSEVPYGYTVAFVYVNENTVVGNNTVGFSMQGSESNSGGSFLRGRILPLYSANSVKRCLFKSNTRIGDIISVTLLGEGQGIYSGSVSEGESLILED